MIQFHCPTCGMNHTAPDASGGKEFTCQVCSQVVRIPDPEPPPRPRPAPAPADPRPARPEPREPRADREPRRRPLLSDERDRDRDPRDRDYRDREDRDYRGRGSRGRDYEDDDYRDRDYRRRDYTPRRNFTESAVLCLVMYWLIYPVGLILNFVYLSEARAVQQETGRQPEGRGCLMSLLIFCFWIPLGILVVSIGGCVVVTALNPRTTPTTTWSMATTASTAAIVNPIIVNAGNKKPLPVNVLFSSNRKATLRNSSNQWLFVTIKVTQPGRPTVILNRTLDPLGTETLGGVDDDCFFDSRTTVEISNPDFDPLEVRVP